MLHFYSKQVDHAIFHFQMELRVTRSKHFKVVKIFFDLDRFFLKGKIAEWSATLTLK